MTATDDSLRVILTGAAVVVVLEDDVVVVLVFVVVDVVVVGVEDALPHAARSAVDSSRRAKVKAIPRNVVPLFIVLPLDN